MKLTSGQQSKLAHFQETGKQGQICKLGYSQGSRGNSNFHSTWCVYGEEPFMVKGDSRSAWRKFVSKYGRENVL